MFVTFGRTSKAQNIWTFKRMTSEKVTCRRRTIMNDILLPNQKFCTNVTIIKFELVWEGKYFTIIWLYWRYRKIKIQSTFSKVSIWHETHIHKFFFQNNAQTHWKIFFGSLSLTFICNLTPCIKLPAYYVHLVGAPKIL